MLRIFQPKSVPERSSNCSFWWSLAAAIGIFVGTLVPLILLAQTGLRQTWMVGLLGLAVVLPHLLWLAVVLHFDGWKPRPWPLMMLAVAWGSLISSTVAFLLEIVSTPTGNRLGPPDLNSMIIAPFWEEVTKGSFVILLFIFAQQHLRGAWNGLLYGVLVGTGFGFTEDLVNLMSGLDDFSDLLGMYFLREFFMAHLHSMFTGATGLAAGMAARQGLSTAQVSRWISCGFLIALVLISTEK